MPPRRGTRRGATTRGGQAGRRGRGTRVEDRASQHGERTEERMEGQEERVQPPPQNQIPQNPVMADFMAALAAQTLYNQTQRTERTDTMSRAMDVAKEFRRMDPPKFDGLSSDPLAAHHWLAETRKILRMLAITDDALKVSVVACQLTGNADEWWQAVLEERKDARRAVRAAQRIDEPDVEDISWAEFEAKFEEQYFPHSYREQMRNQFEGLEQGTMTVSEYAVRFQSLSRFSPELVNTEEGKCRRFIKGLRHEIKRSIVTTKYVRFVDLLDAARSVEDVDEEHKKGAKKSEVRPLSPIIIAPPVMLGNQGRKRMRDSFQTTPSLFTFRTGPPSRSGGNPSRGPITCHYCQQPGHIRSQCPRLRALPPPPRSQSSCACFKCGGFGHVARACPQRGDGRSESGSVQQPKQNLLCHLKKEKGRYIRNRKIKCRIDVHRHGY